MATEDTIRLVVNKYVVNLTPDKLKELCDCSDYFKAMFSQEFKEKGSDEIKINLDILDDNLITDERIEMLFKFIFTDFSPALELNHEYEEIKLKDLAIDLRKQFVDIAHHCFELYNLMKFFLINDNMIKILAKIVNKYIDSHPTPNISTTISIYFLDKALRETDIIVVWDSNMPNRKTNLSINFEAIFDDVKINADYIDIYDELTQYPLEFADFLNIYKLWVSNIIGDKIDDKIGDKMITDVLKWSIPYQPYPSKEVYFTNPLTLDLKEGQTLTTASVGDFNKNLEDFSHGLIDANFIANFKWKNIAIAGGAVVACLLGRHNNNIGRRSDIDFFIYGLSETNYHHPADIRENVNYIIKFIHQRLNRPTYYIVGNGVITLVIADYPRNIQIIYSDQQSKYSLVRNFDMDYIRCLYDGKTVYGTVDFIEATMCQCLNNHQFIELFNNQQEYEVKRYYKTIMKGYSVRENDPKLNHLFNQKELNKWNNYHHDLKDIVDFDIVDLLKIEGMADGNGKVFIEEYTFTYVSTTNKKELLDNLMNNLSTNCEMIMAQKAFNKYYHFTSMELSAIEAGGSETISRYQTMILSILNGEYITSQLGEIEKYIQENITFGTIEYVKKRATKLKKTDITPEILSQSSLTRIHKRWSGSVDGWYAIQPKITITTPLLGSKVIAHHNGDSREPGGFTCIIVKLNPKNRGEAIFIDFIKMIQESLLTKISGLTPKRTGLLFDIIQKDDTTGELSMLIKLPSQKSKCLVDKTGRVIKSPELNVKYGTYSKFFYGKYILSIAGIYIDNRNHPQAKPTVFIREGVLYSLNCIFNQTIILNEKPIKSKSGYDYK